MLTCVTNMAFLHPMAVHGGGGVGGRNSSHPDYHLVDLKLSEARGLLARLRKKVIYCLKSHRCVQKEVNSH